MVMGNRWTMNVNNTRRFNRALSEYNLTYGIYLMVDSGNCPFGYTEDTQLGSRYPMGASTGIGTSGGSITYSHSHGLVTEQSFNNSSNASVATSVAAAAPTWYPPYVKVRFCRKD